MVVAPKVGWRTVRFGEIVRLSKERSQSPSADGYERFVGLEHLDPDDLRVSRWGNESEGTTFTTVFKPGQVLLGKRRAYQRKVAVSDFSGVCSSDIYVLESKDPNILLPGLLPYLCQSNAFLQHAVGTSAGSLSPRTNWSSLSEFKVALPPLEEQQRMVDLLSAHRAVKEALQEARDAADKLRRAILLDTFRPRRGTADEFPGYWKVVRVSEAGDVQLGQKRQPNVHKGSNMRPYLRVANVLDGTIDFTDLFSMHFSLAELAKYELKPGDILLNEGQSVNLVGRSAIYWGEIDGCCFQMTLLRFRCGDDLIPGFAQAYFQHLLYTSQFAAMSMQTTSMAHLTAAGFGRMKMPIPPLNEQQEILDNVERAEQAVALCERRAIDASSLFSIDEVFK